MSGPPIPCYVVSLPRSAVRRAALGEALEALGIEPRFVDAVDARTGFDASTEARLEHPRSGRLSDAEYACALSHQLALERFLAGSESHALVLEDDALPSADLARFLDGGHYRRAPLMLLHHSRARVYRRAGVSLFGATTARPLAIACTAAVAYTLDRPTARRLIEANTPVGHVADWPLDIAALGACVVDPMPVGHPPRVGDQSLLGAQRGHRPADAGRFFTGAYLARRWRKALSTRIS